MEHEPMSEWFLRDEILAAFHRWPVIVVFVLVGSLIGAGFALIWPSTYQASTEFSVELNPYRALDDSYLSAFTNAEFRNIDDYKHWQMSQLTLLVSSDDYLGETLTKLRGRDSYWNSVEIPELREMLEVKWRNAGRWLLTAEASSPEQASDALGIWMDVVLEKTNYAISRSRELFQIELALRAFNAELSVIETRQAVLEEIDTNLKEATQELKIIPPDEPLAQIERWQLFTMSARAATNDPSWQLLMDEFPAIGALASQYISWIEMVRETIRLEIDASRVAKQDLSERITAKNTEWELILHEGQGLSATLSLEKSTAEPLEVKRARSYSLAALVGAFLGLLVWLLMTLFKITRRGYR
jgi:uncharacterized protein involved in exopolysaccharide biosynthesis